MTLSLAVPCYNEEKNIPLVLEGFAPFACKADIELVIVDNGSIDASAEVIRALLPRYPFARSVQVDENQGYGHGILAGLKGCTSDFVGWTHADMQCDPGDVNTAYGMIQAAGHPEATYVKGERKGRPLSDTFFTSAMGLFETLYLRVSLHDINAQPNIFHRSFFESWQNPPTDFSLDLYAFYMARVRGLDVKRFPVFFADRIHGESTWNFGLASRWKFIKRTLEYSFKLKKELEQHGVDRTSPQCD
jgi:glycosyltransferase involved in cell wall biosynthesis